MKQICVEVSAFVLQILFRSNLIGICLEILLKVQIKRALKNSFKETIVKASLSTPIF